MYIDISAYLASKGVSLTEQQRQGLSLSEKPMLLLAVPGSGKTTVLVARVATQILSGIPAGKILNLTFSRESARDMNTRFGRLFPEMETPRFSTIHSLCYSILSSYAAQNGRIVPTLTGSDGAPSSSQILRQALGRLQNREDIRFLDDEDIADTLAAIGLCKNRMLSRKEMGDIPCVIAGLAEVYDAYEAVKSENGLMDYDDILLYALTFLRKLPDILSRFRGRYTHINVDEAQDISKVQLEIIRLLTPSGQNLFMVGDEDQSIYGFRGAYPEGILSFEKLFPDGTVCRMEDNFRSRPEILTLCDRFIRQNRERYDKTIRPSRENRPGAIIPFRPSSPDRAMERILQAVKALGPDEHLGILYRNNLSAYPVADLLRLAEVPFTLTSSPVNLNRYHVRSVLDIMMLAENPTDRQRFAAIGKADLDKELQKQLLSLPEGQDYPLLLARSDDQKSRNLGKILRQIRGLPPADSLRIICRELKTGRIYLAKALDREEPLGALRSAIFRQFVRRAATAAQLEARISELEQYFKAPPRPDNARVHLSTIHAAKGLEYDHLLLLDCCEGILPARAAAGTPPDMARREMNEEVRLFYVAATRARETLTLFYPAESDKGLVPSRFLYAFLTPPEKQPDGPQADHFLPGERVIHRRFGNGLVALVQGDVLTVTFENGKNRQLSARMCIQKHLLSFPDREEVTDRR